MGVDTDNATKDGTRLTDRQRPLSNFREEVRIVKSSYDGEWIAVTGDDRCIDIVSSAWSSGVNGTSQRGG